MTTEESKIDCVENTLNELLNVQRDIIERELKTRCAARFAATRAQLEIEKKALEEERKEWEEARGKAIEEIDADRERIESIKKKNKEELEAVSALVTKREEEVKEYKEAAEQATRDMLQEYVCVNVGGKIFETTTRTLSSMSPYFARLLSGTMKQPMQDRHGNIFVDRSPEGFETFIEYARRGCLTSVLKQELNVRRKCDRQAVVSADGSAAAFTEEMEFYGISENPVAENVSPHLTAGMELSIWWMQQRQMFSGEVLMSYKTTTGLSMVWFKYEDGEIWLYELDHLWHLGSKHLEKLKSRNYRAKNNLLHSSLTATPFIHYGTASRWPSCFSIRKAERLKAEGHLPEAVGPHPAFTAVNGITTDSSSDESQEE